MLRGQGSLKELLGQDVVATSYNRKKRLQSADNDASFDKRPLKQLKRPIVSNSRARFDRHAAKALPAWATPKTKPKHVCPVQSCDVPDSPPLLSKGSRAAARAPPQRLTRASSSAAAPDDRYSPASCPVCKRLLSSSNEAINSHLGALLHKQAGWGQFRCAGRPLNSSVCQVHHCFVQCPVFMASAPVAAPK